MSTKVDSGWTSYTTSTRLGGSGRRSGAVTLRRGLATFVTLAALAGGCGDGSWEEGAPQVTSGEQDTGAIVAGTAGFRCHPWSKRAGACGNVGGSSGSSSPGSGGAAGAAGPDSSSAPFTILAPVAGPVAVTTDGTTVVWVEPTAVRSCPVLGCGAAGTPAPINGSPISNPTVDAVALDQGSVYWLSQHLIQRCPLAGGAYNETVATTPTVSVGYWKQLAVRGGVVYGQTKTMVYQCPVGGCDQTPSAFFGQDDDNGTPFAVDDTGVFVTITGEGYGTHYCPLGGCPATESTPLARPGGFHLAAVNGTVYMAELQGNITSCPSGGCPGGTTTLTTGQAALTSMVADASGLYWTTSDGTTGSVLTCALPSCAGGPRTLAANQNNPVSLAVSEHYVVWANAGGSETPGSIMGIAK
jgi:hypothetical protein